MITMLVKGQHLRLGQCSPSKRKEVIPMPTEIIVALLSLAGTALGSMLGVLASSKLTQYRIAQLEDKVSRHNSVIERTYKLEGEVQELQHDVRDLKAYHTP